MDYLLEPISKTEKQSFCLEMMKRLDIQRRNEHFCDVILEVGSGDDQVRLKAHRIVLCAASPFFYSALNSEMKEKKEGLIRLKETSKAVMEEVLEYLYTGHVDINELNAFDLLEMADYFIIPSLKEVSSKFISRKLSLSNCLMAYYSAVSYQCPELQEQARYFILENFMSVTESEGFLNLNIEQVEEWISSDDIKVKAEEEVFHVIVKWMERSERKENERFFELLRHVRIHHMSDNFVPTAILHHPLVKDSETCTEFVLNTTTEVSNGTPRICLKYKEGLVACECETNKTFFYIPCEDKWYRLGDTSSTTKFTKSMGACYSKLYSVQKSWTDQWSLEQYNPLENSWMPVKSCSSAIVLRFASVVNFQGFLFVLGGKKDGHEPSNSVHKYNSVTNIWEKVAPLGVARYNLCAVADKNFLYAIGGASDANRILDTVERFDPESNSWSMVCPTLEKKCFSCGTVVRGKVFIFGGLTGRGASSSTSLIEMYDPALNTWSSMESVGAPKVTLGAVSIKGDVFVIGIWNIDNSLKSFIKIYDVDRNEWRACKDVPGRKLNVLAPLRIPKNIVNLDVNDNA